MYVLNRLHRDFNHRKQPVFTTEDTENTEKYSFYPRIALIGANKAEALAVSLILCRKIKFTAKYSFVFIRVISGQPFPGFSSVPFMVKRFLFSCLSTPTAGKPC